MLQNNNSRHTEVPSWLVTVKYLEMLVGSGIIYLILHHFWGGHMLSSLHQLEEQHGSIANGLVKVWFIFAWAFGLTFLGVIVFDQHSTTSYSRLVMILKGWWISLNAGVFEEFIFRGLVFLSAMVTLPWINTISFGLVKWFYTSVSIPIANWATFHQLHTQLTGHPNWVFGAAVISASAAFRDKHEYLGLIGWVNSWFIGMVMFYLVFHYGLLTAIVAHAAYDAIILTLDGLVVEQDSHKLSPAARRALGL